MVLTKGSGGHRTHGRLVAVQTAWPQRPSGAGGRMPQQQKLDQRPCIAPLHHLHRQTDRRTDRQTDGQTDRQTDRQAGRYFCSPFRCRGTSGVLDMCCCTAQACTQWQRMSTEHDSNSAALGDDAVSGASDAERKCCEEVELLSSLRS